MDYTTEGVKQAQYNKAATAVCNIDKHLKKISRNLTLLTLIPVAYAVYTLTKQKGE